MQSPERVMSYNTMGQVSDTSVEIETAEVIGRERRRNDLVNFKNLFNFIIFKLRF